MTTLIIVLHSIFCVFLILVILLQTGKGAGMGAAFGGGGSQTLFGPRGAGSFIGKLTGVVAALFMLTSITLAKLSSSQRTGIADRVSALNEMRAQDVQPVAIGQSEDTAAAPPVDTAGDEPIDGDAGQSDGGSVPAAVPSADAGPSKVVDPPAKAAAKPVVPEAPRAALPKSAPKAVAPTPAKSPTPPATPPATESEKKVPSGEVPSSEEAPTQPQ